jgi:hypothetical protein
MSPLLALNAAAGTMPRRAWKNVGRGRAGPYSARFLPAPAVASTLALTLAAGVSV